MKLTNKRLEQIRDYYTGTTVSLGIEMVAAFEELLAIRKAQESPTYWEIAGQLFSTKEEALMPGYRGTPEPLYEEPPASAEPASQWVKCSERMPPDETPVLIRFNGEPRIGELRWDHPSHEESYKSFRYWDCPYNDGQSWEVFYITHWMPLPTPPA